MFRHMSATGQAAGVGLDLAGERPGRIEGDLPVLGVTTEGPAVAHVAEFPGAAELTIAGQRPVRVEVPGTGWRDGAVGAGRQVTARGEFGCRQVGLELDLRIGSAEAGRLRLDE